MKFKRYNKIEYGLNPISIAPLIDVIFLLLIFFLLTSSFTSPTGINIRLPRAITSDILKENTAIISITGEDIIYLNNSIVTIEDLRASFKKNAGKSLSVLIKADQRASLGRMVEIWNICRESGIEKINLATNREERAP